MATNNVGEAEELLNQYESIFTHDKNRLYLIYNLYPDRDQKMPPDSIIAP